MTSPLDKRFEQGGMLAERFELRRSLGSGGMGVVYEAYDAERGGVVALKFMRNMKPSALYRFKNEFRSLSDVRHDNLVRLYELMAVDNDWFFTMELIDGVTFLEYVRPSAIFEGDTCVPRNNAPALANYAISTADTAELPQFAGATPFAATTRSQLQLELLRPALRQLALGVDALHRARQLHLDIKPSNILVAADGRVALCDFGLTRRLSPATSDVVVERGLIGTVSHMSPEQAGNRPLSEASDWYSVGVVLYEALTARLPFEGDASSVLLRKQSLSPPRVKELAPEAPSDLAMLCDQLLATDPGHRPAAKHILGVLCCDGHLPRPRPVARPTATSSFVGRSSELAKLEDAFRSARTGHPVSVFIRGASGVGKTALVGQFIANLRKKCDVLALRGRCFERESVPYKAFDSVIDGLSELLLDLSPQDIPAMMPRDIAALARLFPVLHRVELIGDHSQRQVRDPHESRQRAFAALRELLTNLARGRRIVLAIDDVQWGDADSGRLLRELTNPRDAPPLLVLATVAEGDDLASPMLASLKRRDEWSHKLGDVRELQVGPLSDAESVQVASDLLDQRNSEQALAIARESAGNPFFIAELARHAVTTPSVVARDGVKLTDVLLARIEALGDAERELLTVVAVAGQPIPRWVALRAAGVNDDDASAALATLQGDLLVRPAVTRQPGLLECYHNRIRQSVIEMLPAPAAHVWHRRLAIAYEKLDGVDPEILVEHRREAGDDDKAGHHAVRAAELATESLAFDRAARLYRVALELGEWPPERGLELRIAYADALAAAGRGAEAAEAWTDVAQVVPSPAMSLELRRRAAEQWLYTGHFERGLEAIRQVLAAIGLDLARTPRRALVALLLRRSSLRVRGLAFRRRESTEISPDQLTRVDILWSAATGLSMIDTIRGADFQTRHLRLSLKLGEPYRVVRSLAMESAYAATSGSRSAARAKALAERAQRIAATIDDPHPRGFVSLIKGVGALLRGEWKEARDFSFAAERIFREDGQGAAWELTNAGVYALVSLGYLGELSTLARVLPERIREANQRGNLYMINWLRSGTANMLRLANDEPDRAKADVESAAAQWAQSGFHVQHYFMLWSHCQIAMYNDRGDEAWRLVSERWKALRSSLLLRVQYVRIQAYHLRARCAIACAAKNGDERLLDQATADAARLGREQSAWARAQAFAIRGGVAHVRGDGAAAADHYDLAREAFAAVDMSLFSAASRLQACRARGADVEAAQKELLRMTVKDPLRMSSTLVPGAAR